MSQERREEEPSSSPNSEEKPTKSFSINSILARVTKEKEKEKNAEENKSEDETRIEEDVPAVVSKLEFPVFPGLPKGFPALPRAGDSGMLSFGHLPAWYHWYTSQHCLQQWQNDKKKSE